MTGKVEPVEIEVRIKRAHSKDCWTKRHILTPKNAHRGPLYDQVIRAVHELLLNGDISEQDLTDYLSESRRHTSKV